jgi:hypothetical protein
MTTSSSTSSQAPDAYERLTPSEEIEQAASFTELAAGGALRAVEVLLGSLLALLLCPPLLILVVIVGVPLVATVVLVALVAAVFAAPYLLVRHLRGHEVPHATVFRARARHAAHALADLLPHRVHRAAREA